MDEAKIRELVAQAAAEVLRNGSVAPVPPGDRIPVEISARHVHLTDAALALLFGPGASLEPARALSQPGEFLSDKRLKIVTPQGQLEHVAVLGPARKALQVELSRTDCRALGIEAPVRLSGDLTGAADVYLVGPVGMLFAKGSAIVAQSHIHMTPADARRFGLVHGQVARAQILTERPVTLGRVAIRVSENFSLALHIDFDEANACGAVQTTECVIDGPAQSAPPAGGASPATDAKVITEAMAKELCRAGGPVLLRRGTILTPAAKDVFSAAKIMIEDRGALL
ncbi:MAG: phosphate propanoyltransferase [Oscillospiraceae bacterium]|jgi:propanediol utilization protein|nr:phosphate propanoyltransferase [Oscillospiraceae bacterium]